MNKKEILYNILTSDDVVSSIKVNLDVILSIIPEIKYMIDFEHKNPHHHLNVFDHTLYALSLSENNFEIRLCLLLHDIGKPFSYTEGDVRHYYNHAYVSSQMSKKILSRLEYEDVFINEVCELIKLHDTRIKEDDINDNLSMVIKRYKIQRCDALAHHPDKLEKRKIYLKKIENMIGGIL